MSIVKDRQYEREIQDLKRRIATYRETHEYLDPLDVAYEIIYLKRDLITTEIKLSDVYNVMYRLRGINTYEDMQKLQTNMYNDISSLQDDVMDARAEYSKRHEKRMQEQYKEPVGYRQRIKQGKEIANYHYRMFYSVRELLDLQNKKLSYCKNMNEHDTLEAVRFKEKLTDEYCDCFNELFLYTEREVENTETEAAKRLLEVRMYIIDCAQRDYSAKGRKLITRKPSILQAICDGANRVTGYKKLLKEDIELHKYILEQEREMREAEREYYERGEGREELAKRKRERVIDPAYDFEDLELAERKAVRFEREGQEDDDCDYDER